MVCFIYPGTLSLVWRNDREYSNPVNVFQYADAKVAVVLVHLTNIGLSCTFHMQTSLLLKVQSCRLYRYDGI